MSKHILNINDLEFMDWGNGEEFAAKFGLISRRIGSKNLGYNLTVVPPGKRGEFLAVAPVHNLSKNQSN